MQFVCRYGTPDGQVLTQVQAGNDVAGVRRELERQGFHIFEIRPRSLPFKLALPFGRRRKLPAETFLAFNQEMAALLRAGLPLAQALDLMLERMDDVNLRTVLSEIRDRVKSGEELSEAFDSFGDLFPPLYAATLRAGERSGELESVIRRFIRYQKLVITARKRVVSALFYPTVLILLSIAMLAVMAVFVVPKFTKFYADLDADLPLMTEITLGISVMLREYAWWIVIGLAAGVFAYRTWRATPRGRGTLDRWRLRLPLLGPIFHQFALSEFCRSMATLLSGGIPLVSAMETSVRAVSNAHVSSALVPAIDGVREGGAFYNTLEETGVVPHMAVDMIKVGEATGSLDEMLTSVADYFDERVETRMERLLSLVEPIMLIVMGGLVAFLLISVYMPIFGAFAQVG